MTQSELNQLIDSTIISNNRKSIDAPKLNNVLKKIVGSLSAGASGVDFYAESGTLSSNRTVNANGFDLQFTNGKSFKFQSNNAPSAGLAAFNIEGNGTTYLDVVQQLKTGAGTSYEAYGNKTHRFYGQIGINGVDANTNYGIFAQGYIAAARFAGSIYSVIAQGSGNYADFFSDGTNKNHGFYMAQIPNAAAFKVENPGGGDGAMKIAFQSSDWGTNTGGYNYAFDASINAIAAVNTGFRANVLGGSNNYAFHIVNGQMKTPSGVGLTEILTFESSTPGTVSSLTFDRGILIDKTLVP